MSEKRQPAQSHRREFLNLTAGAAVAAGIASTLPIARSAHAAENDVIKVGLIGCGGRGSGAAANAVSAGPNIKLVAMADVFPDQLQHSVEVLKKQHGEKIAVTPETSFVGFDAYAKLMATDVDVVLLATPPHFRPAQLKAAIEAGKHVFCEKPVAVDGPGLRSVLDTVKKAKEKNLAIVSGLCWRYDHGVRETMKRILGGEIGDIVAIQENYLTGTLWDRPRQESWSEMEFQLRNWLYYTWLSGDHIVEQHVHSLDKALWLMGDKPPVRCFGLGGRQVRTDPIFGHIYDHFAVCYEWDNDVKCYAYTRQMKGCSGDVEDYVLGTKGRAAVLKHIVEGAEKWKYRGDKPSMYQVEHNELFAGIREGHIINNGEYMTNSTLMAIMGREACYSGQVVTSDELMKSENVLGPREYAWTDIPRPAVATPGVTAVT